MGNFDDDLWKALVGEYLRLRRSNNVPLKDSHSAYSIIKFYYSLFPNPAFELGLASFREKYIDNETKIEQPSTAGHCLIEKKGMASMYDYIEKYEFQGGFTIFEIINLHKLLFSHAPHPECAGCFREIQVYLPGSDVELCLPERIASEFCSLSDEFDKLMEFPFQTCENMIRYIEQCVILTSKLLVIHPFFDGNGRSTRALQNLMFKRANLPPVYVTSQDKLFYQNALKLSQTSQAHSDIVSFYLYKICDSLVEITNKSSSNELENDKPLAKRLVYKRSIS